jgi:hypothetical protein
MMRRTGCCLLAAGAVWLGGCQRRAGGDLTIEQLSAVVAQEQDSLEPCYQTALDKQPYDHEFRIETRLEIRADGSVAKVGIDKEGLKGVGPCVKKAIQTWKFPQAREDTHAALPIIFRPKVVKTLPEDLKLPPGFKVLQGPE